MNHMDAQKGLFAACLSPRGSQLYEPPSSQIPINPSFSQPVSPRANNFFIQQQDNTTTRMSSPLNSGIRIISRSPRHGVSPNTSYNSSTLPPTPGCPNCRVISESFYKREVKYIQIIKQLQSQGAANSNRVASPASTIEYSNDTKLLANQNTQLRSHVFHLSQQLQALSKARNSQDAQIQRLRMELTKSSQQVEAVLNDKNKLQALYEQEMAEILKESLRIRQKIMKDKKSKQNMPSITRHVDPDSSANSIQQQINKENIQEGSRPTHQAEHQKSSPKMTKQANPIEQKRPERQEFDTAINLITDRAL